MRQIMQFQERENTLVSMAKVLSNSTKKHLSNMYNIQSQDLHEMSVSQLFRFIAKETRVYSDTNFYLQLKSALSDIKLMEWSKVNARNHETYYFQQLDLVDEFMLVLRLMLVENKDHCPRINDKEGGLIKLFKSFHSYSYWRYLWGNMSQRYNNMQAFVDEYTDKAMEQYQLSQAMKEIPYDLPNMEEDKKEEKYFQKRRELGKSLNASSPSKPRFFNKNTSFSNVTYQEDSDDSEDPTWKNAYAEDSGVNQKEDRDSVDSENSLSEQEIEEDQSQRDESRRRGAC